MGIYMTVPPQYSLDASSQQLEIIQEHDAQLWTWVHLADVAQIMELDSLQLIDFWSEPNLETALIVGLLDGFEFRYGKYSWLQREVIRSMGRSEFMRGIIVPHEVAQSILSAWEKAKQEIEQVVLSLQDPLAGWTTWTQPEGQPVPADFYEVAWTRLTADMHIVRIPTSVLPHAPQIIINTQMFEVLMPASDAMKDWIEGYVQPYKEVGHGVGDTGTIRPVMIRKRPDDAEN